MEKENKNIINTMIFIVVFGIIICGIGYVWYSEEQIIIKLNFENDKSQLDAIKDNRVTFIQISAGVLALVGIYLTWRRTKALDKQNKTNKKSYEALLKKNEQDKETDDKNLILQQFSKAAELLNNDKMEASLSGIYLFEKIMNENENYHIQIIEIFSTIIRKIRYIDFVTYKAIDFTELNIDYIRKNFVNELEIGISTILSVLERRNNKESECDLSRINFIAIHRRNSNLQNINLFNTIFDLSDFTYSNFSNSNLSFAVFRNAYVNETKFNYADLSLSNFNGAFLIKSKFNYSIINWTDFRNSKLYNADFEFARLLLPNFKNAELNDVNFKNIKLYIEDDVRENSDNEILYFIDSLKEAKYIKGLQLDENIIEIIKNEFQDLYIRIYGELTDDEIKIAEGE